MVDRVYVFKNHYQEEEKKWFTSETYESTEDPLDRRSQNPHVKNIPFEESQKNY